MATIAKFDQVEHAAKLLAVAASRTDGWIPIGRTSQLPIPGERTDIEEWIERLESLIRRRPSIEILEASADRYPLNLRSVDGRPALLFVDGDLRAENEHAVAIVGSRTADNEALRVAASLAKSLSERGITIVSGLARGIDTAAHQGAIEGQGRTLAVMGTGIDRLFPPENTSLAEAIRVRGALLSQFPPAYGPTKTTFPARNAVIAGLSKVSVIVAASERSGTRIEIDNSIAQGRPVLLWKPLLASQHWARELAREPLVDFIESAIEIEEMLGQAAA